jgi:hypothetical protein
MYNSVLVLYSALHPNEAFMENDHRIGAVNVRHHNDIGMTGLVFQS